MRMSLTLMGALRATVPGLFASMAQTLMDLFGASAPFALRQVLHCCNVVLRSGGSGEQHDKYFRMRIFCRREREKEGERSVCKHQSSTWNSSFAGWAYSFTGWMYTNRRLSVEQNLKRGVFHIESLHF